jgi:hypothetical protein
MENAKGTFAMAVDMVVQVGWIGNMRKILGVWEIEKMLVDGNVVIHPLYQIGDKEIKPMTVR